MKKQLLVSVLLSVMTLPAMASNLYVLADAGQIKYEGDSSSETATGFTLGGGYKFNDSFAIEVAYRDLGDIEGHETEVDGETSIEEDYYYDFTALQISLVAGFPVGESVNIYGRLGYADIDVETSFSVIQTTDGDTLSHSGSGTISSNEVLFGVGVSYALSESFALRTEYGQYGKFEGIETSSITFGLTYGF
jgi:opacity protein-like surface antigen